MVMGLNVKYASKLNVDQVKNQRLEDESRFFLALWTDGPSSGISKKKEVKKKGERGHDNKKQARNAYNTEVKILFRDLKV